MASSWYRTTHNETSEMIAADYRRGEAARAKLAEWWDAKGLPFEGVIDRAVLSTLPDGKRHPHQRRIPAETLERCRVVLRAMSRRLEAATSFHELWMMVDDAFKPIFGAGELLTYDVADRIAERLELYSAYLIYLHAGARVGARRLHGGSLPRGDAWAISVEQVPTAFREFSNHEIEDILCIYKDELTIPPQELTKRWSNAGGSRSSCSVGEKAQSVC